MLAAYGKAHPLTRQYITSLPAVAMDPNSASPRRRHTSPDFMAMLEAIHDLGRTNKAIACELGLAHATVRVLLARSAAKFRVRNRAALIARCLQHQTTAAPC